MGRAGPRLERADPHRTRVRVLWREELTVLVINGYTMTMLTLHFIYIRYILSKFTYYIII